MNDDVRNLGEFFSATAFPHLFSTARNKTLELVLSSPKEEMWVHFKPVTLNDYRPSQKDALYSHIIEGNLKIESHPTKHKSVTIQNISYSSNSTTYYLLSIFSNFLINHYYKFIYQENIIIIFANYNK